MPHDFGIEGPFRESHPASGEGAFLPTGVGWYRIALPNNIPLRGKHVFIELDGVMANSDVWINGEHLGHRPNGYVGLRYELTSHLKLGQGQANVLAVRSDTEAQVASRWYTGSGIYRNVRLIVVDPLHIDAPSLHVTTPHIGVENSEVQVDLTITNQTGAAAQVVVETIVLDPSEVLVASTESEMTVPAGEPAQLLASLQVPKPQLWDVNDPNLYQVITRLKREAAIVDELNTHFGIRSAEFRSDSGFWLNGRNLKIKGVCLHHDGGAMGAAVPLSV